MSQEIQLYTKLNDPIQAVERLGTMFARSGMFGCSNTEQGQMLALICLAEHKSPVEILRQYDIVEGKPRKKALAALAEFRRAGGKHRWLSSGDAPTQDPTARFAEGEFTDKDGNKVVYRYSMADAKAEGLLRSGSRWDKRPGNMLRARCISNALGMLCPELYAGDSADDECDPAPPATAPKLDLSAAPAGKVVEIKAEVEPPPAEVTTKARPQALEPDMTPEPLKAAPPEDTPALAQMGLAPVAAAATTPPAAETLPGGCDEQTIGAILHAIKTHPRGDYFTRALDFIRRTGMVKPDQGFVHLQPKQASRILNNIRTASDPDTKSDSFTVTCLGTAKGAAPTAVEPAKP